MSDTVVMDVELKSQIERVWQALTDPATLSEWMLFKTNDFKPVVGHTFQFSGAPGWDGAVDCKVLEVDEPNRLSYTWETEGTDNERHATVVTWTLSQAEGSVTKLHLEQRGFRPGATQELAGAQYSWTSMLDQLQRLLAA